MLYAPTICTILTVMARKAERLGRFIHVESDSTNSCHDDGSTGLQHEARGMYTCTCATCLRLVNVLHTSKSRGICNHVLTVCSLFDLRYPVTFKPVGIPLPDCVSYVPQLSAKAPCLLPRIWVLV